MVAGRFICGWGLVVWSLRFGWRGRWRLFFLNFRYFYPNPVSYYLEVLDFDTSHSFLPSFTFLFIFPSLFPSTSAPFPFQSLSILPSSFQFPTQSLLPFFPPSYPFYHTNPQSFSEFPRPFVPGNILHSLNLCWKWRLYCFMCFWVGLCADCRFIWDFWPVFVMRFSLRRRWSLWRGCVKSGCVFIDLGMVWVLIHVICWLYTFCIQYVSKLIHLHVQVIKWVSFMHFACTFHMVQTFFTFPKAKKICQVLHLADPCFKEKP